MNPLNKEQKAALNLQKTNNVIAFLAFLPALICWVITVDVLNYNWTNEVLTFSYSSILLLIFYGYTFISPRIYLFENYITSFIYIFRIRIRNKFSNLFSK